MAQRCRLIGVVALLGILLVLWGGAVRAQEAKQVMIVFTNETDGEVNPCG